MAINQRLVGSIIYKETLEACGRNTRLVALVVKPVMMNNH
jgi:hypothetical protein